MPPPMPSYWQLLALIVPVFVLFALDALLGRFCRLTAESEAGMLRIHVGFFYPARILKRVLGNAALVLARHYGGQPVFAAQIILGTTGWACW